MSYWKDVLCLLAALVIYGLAGHLDYQDAIAMDEAMRDDMVQPCSAPPSIATDRAPRQATGVTPAHAAVTPRSPEPACRAEDR